MLSSIYYVLTGVSYWMYPVIVCYCLAWQDNDNVIELAPAFPMRTEWGVPRSYKESINSIGGMPERFEICWISLVEAKSYSAIIELPTSTMLSTWNEYGTFDEIVLGFAPLGRITCWFRGKLKQVPIFSVVAKEVKFDLGTYNSSLEGCSMTSYCSDYLSTMQDVQTFLAINGVPNGKTIDSCMEQYVYRYLIELEEYCEGNENVPEFDWIEEALYDGSHDKLHDGGLMQYHEAGKPKKLAIRFHRKKTEYNAYFWFDEERIREVFEKFYGAHPDTKADFIIRINADERKYELLLYRQGLKEPVKIREDAYQWIVFKNKFEDCRSDNYNQESGAWIW